MNDNRTKNMETMLFNYETTYKTNYREFEVKPRVLTKYKPKPPVIKPPATPLKDVHTFTDFKKPIAFNVTHKLKEIIWTNPNHVQKAYSKPIDLDRKEVQMTRPRLVMTPAVSLDDIGDDVRSVLVDETYTSDMMRSNKEVGTDYFSVRAPLPGPLAPAKPIFLPPLLPSVVPPEWRMDSVPWDNKQLRADCDPTELFWQSEPLPPCTICDESAVVTAHRQLMRSLKRK